MMANKKLNKQKFKIKRIPKNVISEVSELLKSELVFIGSGTFSQVFAIKGKAAVVKITKDDEEIEILKKIKKFNVLNLPKIYKILKYKNYFIVVMERLYTNEKLVNELKILFGTNISYKGDELDTLFTQELFKIIKNFDLKNKIIDCLNNIEKISLATFLRALAFEKGYDVWTKEYKKINKDLQFILNNFDYNELKTIKNYIILTLKKLDDNWMIYFKQISSCIESLKALNIIHADVAIRNIMERNNGDLCLIDYNLAFKTS